MQINLTLIGIALATMFFGYFFGLFEGRGQGYKKRKKEEGEEFKSTLPAMQVPAPVVKDDPGILRLKEENFRMVLDLDGQRVNTDTLTSTQRKRLIGVLTLMRPWLEGPTSPGPIQAPAPGMQEKVEQAIQPEPAPVTRTSLSKGPAGKPAGAGAIPDEEKPAPVLTIVGQIDTILQQRLAGSPLESKGIRLQESPEGGVWVWVGVKKFETVEDVPEAEIKAAIRLAIKEWEDKFTPGV
jgi:hypothetical protein